MNKKIFVLLMLVVLLATSLASATLFEKYEGKPNAIDMINKYSMRAQTFTVEQNNSHNITTMSLFLYRIGNIGNVIVSIRAVDSNLKPIGVDLTFGIIKNNNITTNRNGGWVNVSLHPCRLHQNTRYAIAIKAPSASLWNTWLCIKYNYPGSYSDGQRFISYNGASWYGIAGDYLFREYGDSNMIFGGHLPGDPVTGGEYFQLATTWGDTYSNLCYCPQAGYANSITVRLYGNVGVATAMVALLRPTAANIPLDAPYWEYGVLGPNFPIIITSADIIAISSLKSITNIGFANATWYTFTFPFVPVSPGYYLLAVCGGGPGAALGITGDSQVDGATNKGGKAIAGGVEHEWPSDLTFTPNELLNFGMNFDIYCNYQTNIMWLHLNNKMGFKNQHATIGGV